MRITTRTESSEDEFTTNLLTPSVISVVSVEQAAELAELAQQLQLGASSAALLRHAARTATGLIEPYRGYEPADQGDLERCERAYAAAPAWLAVHMLEALGRFRVKVAEREASYAEQAERYKAQAAERYKARAARLNALAGQTHQISLRGDDLAVLMEIVENFDTDILDETEGDRLEEALGRIATALHAAG